MVRPQPCPSPQEEERTLENTKKKGIAKRKNYQYKEMILNFQLMRHTQSTNNKLRKKKLMNNNTNVISFPSGRTGRAFSFGRVWMGCLLICSFLFFSCGEDEGHQPFSKGGTPPDPVTVTHVENIPGGAILTYDLPKSEDLLYVKAVFMSNSKQHEVRVSAYTNTLKIEGFGNTDEQKIQLYSVSRSETPSVPVEVLIQPLTPSIVYIRESLSPEVDFGGFIVNFENEDKAEISMNVIRKDAETNKFVDYHAFYTSRESGIFSVRGLPAIENDFGIYVMDKWNNISDTLFFKLTPWREDYLDKKLFKNKTIQGDVAWNLYEAFPENAYDEKVANGNYAHTDFPQAFPHRFTLDLGVNVKLSRFKFWQRPGDDVLYQHGAPKRYNIYGRADDPGNGNPGDVLLGWTLLMECESIKPSGLPLGQNSSEDVEYAALGEEYIFPREIEEVRYIRLEMLESWSGMECSTISEISFWGQISE